MDSERAAADPEYPINLLRFVARFDRAEYWLAHEELEELWLRDRRDFYKGLIQIAAGFLHVERSNWRGGVRLLRTGLGYLGDAPDAHCGFDVGALRARVGEILAAVEEVAAEDAAAAGARAAARSFSMGSVFAGPADAALEAVELPYRVRRYDEGYRP